MDTPTPEQKPVFDSSAKFEVKAITTEGTRKIAVRFPTDEEWTDWHGRKKYEIVSRGGNLTETVLGEGSEEADADLVSKIRSEPVPEIEPFHAGTICQRLAQAEVVDAEREGDNFRLTLRVPGGQTSHLLRVPTATEWQRHDKRFGRLFDSGNKKIIVTNLKVAADLYVALCMETNGYPGSDARGVPILHQVAAVSGIIAAIKAELRDDGNEVFQ